MSNSFQKMDGAKFNSLYQDVQKISECLNHAYSIANVLHNQMECDDWKGRSKDEMLAYLDLLLQYHGALIGQRSDSNPVQEGSLALAELLNHLNQFYFDCNIYKKLESLE
jgi:hypothetical protein